MRLVDAYRENCRAMRLVDAVGQSVCAIRVANSVGGRYNRPMLLGDARLTDVLADT